MTERPLDRFCSNCAVELARKGYAIEEISKTLQCKIYFLRNNDEIKVIFYRFIFEILVLLLEIC